MKLKCFPVFRFHCVSDCLPGLIVDSFISILTSLAAFPNFIPLLSSSEYQFIKEFIIFLLNSSLQATSSGCSSPVHDARTNLILISLSSSLSLNESVKIKQSEQISHDKCNMQYDFILSSANKLVDRKVHFFMLLRNKKYAKKGTREFVQLGETAKIGCSEN